MVVVDASIWVSWFKADDRFHEQAEKIFQAIELCEETICIPATAFTEVAGVMKRTTQNDNLAWGAVYYMKGMELEVLTDFDKLEPLATEIAIKYGVKGMDAYYLAVAELTKSKLYTFDMQQEDAFEAISRDWQAE